jgi:crossover junction endodeoxyribonuclease RuvC
MRIVLGIDVGTADTGWAIISVEQEKRKLLAYGSIKTSSKDPMPYRLVQIHEKLGDIIKEYEPMEMAVESLFYFKNQKTVMTVSQGRGVILLTAEENHLQIFEYTPLQVKMGVTGYGRAEKSQVQQMVKLIMGLTEIPKPDDAADAIAIAITHINTYRANLQ